MTRLIDADTIPWLVEGVGEIPVITKEEIDQLPTVDIPTVGESVGVIRCKDCKYRNEYGYCTLYIAWHHLTGDMDYCSDGERKEE